MPKYTVIIGGKERTIDKDKFDGNVDAISAKYPDARIKAINGNTEGMLPVSNYSKAIKQGYKMVEMNDVEPTPAVDPLHVQTIDSVRDYKPVIEVGANKPFDIVKEMNEPTDTQKREEERKRIEEQARKAKKASDTMHLNASADKVKADYDALSNPFTAMAAALNPVMGSGIRTVTDAQVKAEKNKDLARISGEKADDTINMIEEAKKKGDTSFVSGFGRGFWEKVSKASTWDFGARDLQSNLALAAAVDKQSKGLALSAEEDALLDAVALEAAAQGEFSGDLGRGYKAGSTSAESLPFMAEFMINPATGTGAAVGKAATKQLISKFGKEAAKSTIGKIARVSARAAGDVAGAAAMAGTTGVVRTSSDAVDRMSGEVKSTIDSDGYYRFDGMEGGDVSFKAFAKAYGASTIENFSEMFGNYLMPVGSALGGASSTIMNKIGLGKVNDIIGRVKSSDAAKIVNDFQKRTQWNGTIGEYLEEQAGMAMNALTVGDNKLSDLVDVDTQIDTFLGVSAFGGFFSGIKTAGYAKQKYKEKKKLNEAGMEASNAIGDGWEPLKDRIDEADDAELHSILSETMSDREISDEQKQSVLLYAGRLKAYHGANLADLKRKTEGDTPNEIVQAQVNFDAGYKLAEADRREKRLAAKELEAIESKLDDEFISADENTRYELMRQRSEAGEDVANELSFINAQSRFDGMIHGIRDAIDEKVASSNQYIQRSTHSDGNVYDVTLTTDDKKHVYPISGSIVIGESGIIDRRQSDKRFITRDENGNIEMRPVEDLYRVESFENSDVMKEITAQSIREQESARYAEEIETPNEEEKVQEVESLQAGSEVDLNINGVVHSAVVQSIYSDGNIEIRFDEKIVGHDGKEKNVDVFSADEVLSFIIPRESAPIDTEELKNGTENIIEGEEIAGDIKNEEEKENISSEILPSEDSITSIIEQPIETPSSESSDANTLIDPVSIEQAPSTIGIPVDDKGNELYHKVPVETTLENVRSYGLNESEMDEFVAAQKAESTKRLEKLQKGKPKVGTNLSKYQSEKKAWENSVLDVKSQVDYWNEIDAQIQATRVQPGDVTAEAIASMGDPMNAEEFTAAMLGSGKLPLLFGDYKRETGFSNQDAKGMFGLFSSKSNGGMSIEEAGERLMEMDASNGTNFFDQSDANAGRNTIIDILSSSRTRGDLFGYIKGSRERMAEQERQAEYDAYEMWVNNVARMSIADYEVDMETTDNRLKEYFESFNFDEINGDIADDLIKEENDRGTKESVDESISGGNTTDIQGEPNQSSGSGSVEQPEGSGAIEESERGRQGVAEEVDVSGVDVVGSESIDGLGELTSTQIAVPSAKDGENPFDYAMRVVGAKKLHDEQRKVDVNPTEAQKEAGNYRMGHVKIGGHDVTIENPKGSVRRGVDKDGKEWEISMNNTYGYFRGTKGKDGDHIDTFLGDNLEPKSVYVVDQVNEDGTFDEHKVMYGFDTEEDAKAAYMSNYEEGWKGFGNITGVPREVFDEWLKNGTKKQKPFAEYKAVRGEATTDDNIRFRVVDENDVVSFAQKYNLDEVDIQSYSKYMQKGNLQGASLAFENIKRNLRLSNSNLSFGEFVKVFSPVKAELYEKFGNVNDLREEYLRSEMEERNLMDAARKRVKEEAETVRNRLMEFQNMNDEQLDNEYSKSIDENNELRIRDLVNEAARRRGYDDVDSNYQGAGAWAAPSSGGLTKEERIRIANAEEDTIDLSLQDLTEVTRPNNDMLSDHRTWRTELQKESGRIINNAINEIRKGQKNVKVKVYRAVPTDIKEGDIRNGDWVTPSRGYAELHGNSRLQGKYKIIEKEVLAEHLFWDENDIQEWGYDDGKSYRYKNTKNNRKLNDFITRDDFGNIIPLSKRFNARKADIRYRSNEIERLQSSANKFASQFMVDDIISVLDHDEFVEKLKDNGIEEVEGPAINLYSGNILVDKSYCEDENTMKKYIAHEIFHTFVHDHLSVDEVEAVGSIIGEDKLSELTPGYELEDTYGKVNELIALIGSSLHAIGKLQELLNGRISSNELTIWIDANLKKIPKDMVPLVGKVLNVIENGKKQKEASRSKERVSGLLGKEPDISRGERAYGESIGFSERIERGASVDKTERGDVERTISERRGSGGYTESEREAGEIRDSILRETETLAEKLHAPVRTVEDLNDISDNNPILQKRKRDSKGWYDPSTGEIVIVLPNASSVEDVQSTILHEVVAHKGLRDMFGDEFDSFLDKVYRDVDGVIREKITALSRKHGFDTRVATEEYLAVLAERGFDDVSEKSAWRKIKDFFMEMLSKVGIEMSAPINDVDLRYILWRSYENQVEGSDIVSKANRAVRDRDIRSKLMKEPIAIADAPVRFREDTDNSDTEDIAKREYEDSLDKTKNRMYRWQEAYQDSMLGLKKMQDAIEKESGDKLKYFEDAYMAENQMSSKSAHETEIYKDKFLIPMMDSVKSLIKNGAKQDEVKMYVMAKHGLERNREFAWRDALRSVENDEGKDFANGIQLEHDSIVSDLKSKLRSGKIDLATYDHEVFNTRSSLAPSYIANRASDYSGLVQLTGEEVNFEIVAKEMVDGFESMHSDLCDVLWEKINAATKQTLKKSYQSGLMTKRIYDKIKGMFDFYVPLRGWNDDVASDVYEYVLSERSVFNAPVKAAFGRKSMADDPFAVIGNMAESGILQGNRNLMKQKFLNMVLNHPTSLATVKTMWYENVGTVDDPVWEQSLPTIEAEATADEIAQAIDNHEARMVELSKSGMATKSTNGISLDYRASKREKSEHSVVVKSGGKEYVIFVNGNPRAAQAVNGLTNPDATDHKFMQMIGKVNRQLAANFTTRNPAFVLSNMSRDVIFSTSAIWIKEDWKYAKRFDKNIAKNIGAIVGLMARYKSGRLDMRNARDRYFLEFLENGGETGYTAIHNVEEYKKMMDRHVKKSNGTMGSLSSGVHAIVDAVSFMNRCAENVSRFTTYQTSREMGRGIVDSIRDAKEVTVNFNKKGAGGLGAGTIKSLFLFFNAAVQSLNNFKGLHDRSRGKFYTTLGGFSAAGILLPMINNFIIESLIGDGDDDMTDEERAEWKKKRDSYDNLPEWVRKNNFCLWVGGEHFITIPLPIELRAFYGLGEMWYQMGRGNMNGVDGKLDTKKASIEMVNQLTELLPINPLGGNGDAISVLVPDAGKPFYQIFTNRDFFGKPIYKKNDYNELMPAWTKTFSGTAKWMVNSAEFLNEVSGGDKYMTGGVDLNPAVVEHVFEGYFGGMGKTANQLFKTLSMIWDEDERMWRNVPVANRFFTGSDNKISFRKVNDAYYQYLNEYKETEQRLKGYENEAEMDIEKYAEKYDFLNGSKQHERYLIMKEYKAGIDAMRNAIKESDPEEKKGIEMEINLLKMEMIEELGKIE